MCLCLCVAARQAEALRGLTGHGDSWAAPTELIWITPAFGARLRRASLSSYRLCDTTPLPLSSPCTLEWREMLERKGSQKQREGEEGDGERTSWTLGCFFFYTPGVTVLTSHKETYLRKRTEGKQRGRKKQQAPLPSLCFGARRIER